MTAFVDGRHTPGLTSIPELDATIATIKGDIVDAWSRGDSEAARKAFGEGCTILDHVAAQREGCPESAARIPQMNADLLAIYTDSAHFG